MYYYLSSELGDCAVINMMPTSKLNLSLYKCFYFIWFFNEKERNTSIHLLVMNPSQTVLVPSAYHAPSPISPAASCTDRTVVHVSPTRANSVLHLPCLPCICITHPSHLPLTGAGACWVSLASKYRAQGKSKKREKRGRCNPTNCTASNRPHFLQYLTLFLLPRRLVS